MRDHCRTQHGFDPMPNPTPQAFSYLKRQQNRMKAVEVAPAPPSESTAHPSEATERFLKMMRNCIGLQKLGSGQVVSRTTLDSIGSIDNALDYLVDNFVIMGKWDIEGISGYLCNNCLSFQYQYINEVGFDETAEERHECMPPMLHEAKKVQNRIARESQVRKQAVDSLIMLTNSLFPGKKYLIVDSDLERVMHKLHAPLIKFNSITPEHWAWRKISHKKVLLTEIGVKNFVMRTGGTYALIFVESGIHSGHHLMYIVGE
jgi:hypothetical protein